MKRNQKTIVQNFIFINWLTIQK